MPRRIAPRRDEFAASNRCADCPLRLALIDSHKSRMTCGRSLFATIDGYGFTRDSIVGSAAAIE
jgi:hypothetical protein